MIVKVNGIEITINGEVEDVFVQGNKVEITPKKIVIV